MRRILFPVCCCCALVAAAENYSVKYVGKSTADGAKAAVAEGLDFSAVYTDTALVIRFTGAADGAYRVQIRPGVKNAADVGSPIAFDYDTASRKVVDLCPAKNTAWTRKVAPKAEQEGKKGEPCKRLQFTIPFREHLESAPFPKAAGQRPASWRIAVRHTAPGGKTSDWGTPDAPNFLSWGRGPDAVKVQTSFFADPGFKNAWGGAQWWACGMKDRSGKEKWVGYLDPGVETFQWRNAASEKLFVERRAERVLRIYQPFMELLNFSERGENKSGPAILKASQADQDKYFAMLPGMLHAKDAFVRERRDYLNDRFFGREIAELPPREAFKGPRKAPRTLGRAKTATLDDDSGSISLDDDDL